jgi:hypothetical protein
VHHDGAARDRYVLHRHGITRARVCRPKQAIDHGTCTTVRVRPACRDTAQQFRSALEEVAARRRVIEP